MHVLNTWDTSRLFPAEAIAQMRAAANRALAVADPSTAAQPVSFSQQPPPNAQPGFRGGGAPPSGPNPAQQQDMELRSLLTKVLMMEWIFHGVEGESDEMACLFCTEAAK